MPQDTPEDLVVGFNPNFTANVQSSNGLVQWLINGIPMAIDLEHPTLQSVVIDGNDTFTANRHVFEVTEKDNVRQQP